MYRTEASLRVLVNAIETYRDAHGAYPPAGPKGLDAAVRYLSRNVDYMPGGAPLDAWDRPFHYVPHAQYAEPGSAALRNSRGGFHAPNSYQVYSSGADGDPGLANSAAAGDNITSWDARRSWRAVYRTLNRQYTKERGR